MAQTTTTNEPTVDPTTPSDIQPAVAPLSEIEIYAKQLEAQVKQLTDELSAHHVAYTKLAETHSQLIFEKNNEIRRLQEALEQRRAAKRVEKTPEATTGTRDSRCVDRHAPQCSCTGDMREPIRR